MKKLIITTFLLTLSVLSYAEDRPSEPAFCEWLGEAASSVAVSRDNGVEENDLIGKLLNEDKSYGEQSVVIPLIDRVYGFEGNLNPDEVAFVERQRCEVALVSLRK